MKTFPDEPGHTLVAETVLHVDKEAIQTMVKMRHRIVVVMNVASGIEIS